MEIISHFDMAKYIAFACEHIANILQRYKFLRNLRYSLRERYTQKRAICPSGTRET